MNRLCILLAGALTLGLPASLSAQDSDVTWADLLNKDVVVELASGETLAGTLIVSSDSSVTIATSTGIVTRDKSDVVSARRTASPSPPDDSGALSALRACPERALALPKDMEDVHRAVVHLKTTLGSGSGVFISPDGFIATAAHVVGSASSVEVALSDGATIAGRVVRLNPSRDLALIQIEATNTPCIASVPERAPAGTDVYVVGSPGGQVLTHSISRGIVSAYRQEGDLELLQTDASINPGSSGGPMVDGSGRLLGVVSFKAVGTGVEGLGFGIAAGELPEALGYQSGSSSDDPFPTRSLNVEPPQGVSAKQEEGPQIEWNAEPRRFAADPGWCRRWTSETEDPFTGATVFRAEEPNRGRGGWVIEARESGLVLLWPADSDVIGFSTGSDEARQRTTLKLADTNRNVLGLESMGPPLFGASGGRAWLLYEFAINRKVLRHLAGSPLRAQRFEFEGGRVASAELDPDASRARDLQKAAACAYEATAP